MTRIFRLISLTRIVFSFVWMGAMTANVIAGDFDWMNERQRSAVSNLAAGYSGGLLCDRLVDSGVAGTFLAKAFDGRTFSAHEVASIGKIITGVIAMETGMVGNNKRYCATVRGSFGPSGTDIPGLLD